MIFEALAARMRQMAERRAAARRDALAAALAGALPAGIEAEAVEEGVRLAGRGLKRRFARDAALRWLIAEKTR
jgi:anthranilate phosphoribosyltransferase